MPLKAELLVQFAEPCDSSHRESLSTSETRASRHWAADLVPTSTFPGIAPGVPGTSRDDRQTLNSSTTNSGAILASFFNHLSASSISFDGTHQNSAALDSFPAPRGSGLRFCWDPDRPASLPPNAWARIKPLAAKLGKVLRAAALGCL